MSNPAPTSTAIPFAMATLGIASFSTMDVMMKGLSISLGAYNAMLWRMLAGIVLGGFLFFVTRTRWPARSTFKLHLLRGSIAAFMAVSFFWGLARVPIAEAIALSFIAPLITLYLAAVLLGEKISRAAIAATVMGFAGVIVILSARATGEYQPEVLKGIGAILVSAVLYAYNLVLQRQQAQLASPIEIVFFQNLTAGSVLLLGAPWLAVVPDISHAPAIVSSTVMAIIALLLLSWAYARAEAQVLVPVEYTAFIWAAIFGWYFYKEAVSLATLVGTGLIVAGCFIATRQKPAVKPSHVEVVAL
jgi:S-adenosylmethionine uptake transporter